MSADKAFNFALADGKLITSLDQVAAKYGFDKNKIFTNSEGQLAVYVRINVVDGQVRIIDFYDKPKGEK